MIPPRMVGLVVMLWLAAGCGRRNDLADTGADASPPDLDVDALSMMAAQAVFNQVRRSPAATNHVAAVGIGISGLDPSPAALAWAAEHDFALVPASQATYLPSEGYRVVESHAEAVGLMVRNLHLDPNRPERAQALVEVFVGGLHMQEFHVLLKHEEGAWRPLAKLRPWVN